MDVLAIHLTWWEIVRYSSFRYLASSFHIRVFPECSIVGVKLCVCFYIELLTQMLFKFYIYKFASTCCKSEQ